MSLLLCDRVIVDLNNKTPSIIGVFQRMNVVIQAGVPLPENAISPIRWSIFSLWQHDDADSGKEFVHHTEIVGPDGSIFATTVSPYTLSEPNDLQGKVFVEVIGLPIYREGIAKVRVWLEGYEQAKGEYPFFIIHDRKAADESAQSQQQTAN